MFAFHLKNKTKQKHQKTQNKTKKWKVHPTTTTTENYHEQQIKSIQNSKRKVFEALWRPVLLPRKSLTAMICSFIAVTENVIWVLQQKWRCSCNGVGRDSLQDWLFNSILTFFSMPRLANGHLLRLKKSLPQEHPIFILLFSPVPPYLQAYPSSTVNINKFPLVACTYVGNYKKHHAWFWPSEDSRSFCNFDWILSCWRSSCTWNGISHDMMT